MSCFGVMRWIPKTELYMLEVGQFELFWCNEVDTQNGPTFKICSSVLGVHLVTPKQLKLPNF